MNLNVGLLTELMTYWHYGPSHYERLAVHYGTLKLRQRFFILGLCNILNNILCDKSVRLILVRDHFNISH